MKRLFKPMAVCLGIAVPIWLLGLYWMIGVREIDDTYRVIASGSILMLIASGIAIWGYRKRDREALSTGELLILMVISFFIGISIFVVGAYEIFGLYTEEGQIIRLFLTVAVIGMINLISCVAFTHSIKKKRNIGEYIWGVVGIPFIIYIGLSVFGRIGEELVLLAFLIVCIYSLGLLILQILFILKRDKGVCFFPKEFETVKAKRYYWIVTFVVLIVLPYIGLGINVINLMGNRSGIVGNFSHPIFWIMPLINGLAFMILPPKSLNLRRILFYIKGVGCTFILYFFVSFIPLTPLGFIGVALYGLGLLVFIPTLALLWEVCYIVREAKSLFGMGHKRSCVALLVVGLLTLPILFVGKINLDRVNFRIATDYITGEEIQKPVNKDQLSETIDVIQSAIAIEGRLGLLNGEVTPILSRLYTKGIIKESTIDWDDISRMRILFLDTEEILDNKEMALPVGNLAVNLKNVKVSTTYDEKQDLYRSWIDLTLENISRQDTLEYATAISLPDNAYVSDYYLVVGEEKKQGILTDERAATRLYQSIVSRNLDPGLLKYFNDETLELRVFPFNSGEVRQTGFEVIHTGAATLKIGDYTCELGVTPEPIKQDYGVIKAEGVTILPGDYIETLPKEEDLLPHYYFLIDGSKDSDRKVLAKRAQSYIQEQGLKETEIWVVEEGILSKGIEDVEIARSGDGGYNFNGALQQILREEKEGYYPIVMAVTSDFSKALWPYKMKDLAQKYPQSSYYYELNSNLELTPHVLYKGATRRAETTKMPILADVRNYEGHLVLNTGRKQFIYTGPLGAFISTQNAYKDGCLLEAMSQYGEALSEEKLLEVVNASFSTRLLTKQTAFIVVETKEQEEDLLYLQEKYLSGEINDNGSSPVSMSEPSLILCGVLLLAIMRRSSKRQKI